MKSNGAGPGCSSIAFGQSEEIGPFHINADGKTLHPNPYSWNRGEEHSFPLSLETLLHRFLGEKM